MEYLLKTTIAWALFLFLFETVYKHNRHFAVNRIYLLLSFTAGILLPFISIPAHAPAVFSAAKIFYAAPGYIILHEAAHYHRWHWLALWLMHAGR